jgi:hypothetical protein
LAALGQSGFKNLKLVWKQYAFSLTPALSRWEREKRSLPLGKTSAASGSNNLLKPERRQLLFPLPAGEG